MSNKTKYLIGLLGTILVLAILGLAFFLSNKKIRNLSINNNLIPEVKKEEVNNQQKFVDLYNQGNFTELNKLLDSQLSNNPGNFDLLLQKGNALAQEASLAFKEKELGDRAMDFVNQALDINPDSVEALTLKGYIYEIQQDYVNAHKYYDQALKIEPNNVDTLAQKGHAYDLQGNIKEAQKLYEKALGIDPENEDLTAKYARLVFFSDTEKAKNLYQKLSKSTNNRVKAEAFYSLGKLSQTEKYSSESEQYFKQSSEADPAYANAYLGLAFEDTKHALSVSDPATQKELIISAFKKLDKSIKLNPGLSSAYIQKALLFISSGKKDNAKKILQDMLKFGIDQDITLNQGDKELSKNFVRSLMKTI